MGKDCQKAAWKDHKTNPPHRSKKNALLLTCSYPRLRTHRLPGTIDDGLRMKEYLENRGFHVTWLRDDVCPDCRGTGRGCRHCNVGHQGSGRSVTPCERSRTGKHAWEKLCETCEGTAKVMNNATGKAYCSPTKANIEVSLINLAQRARRGDVTWVCYSGHGGQKEGHAPSEEDGIDECIVPSDIEKSMKKFGDYASGYITDNWLNTNFVAKLPQGSQTTVMFDCCLSGKLLDLPYRYQTNGEWKETRSVNTGPDAGFVLYLSACKADEYGHETYYEPGIFDKKRKGGTLITEFLYAAERYGKNNNASLKMYIDLIQSSPKLKDINQTPCLSSSHSINVNQSFGKFLTGGVKIRIKCRKCDGSGKVPVVSIALLGLLTWQPWACLGMTEECPDCNGRKFQLSALDG